MKYKAGTKKERVRTTRSKDPPSPETNEQRLEGRKKGSRARRKEDQRKEADREKRKGQQHQRKKASPCDSRKKKKTTRDPEKRKKKGKKKGAKRQGKPRKKERGGGKKRGAEDRKTLRGAKAGSAEVGALRSQKRARIARVVGAHGQKKRRETAATRHAERGVSSLIRIPPGPREEARKMSKERAEEKRKGELKVQRQEGRKRKPATMSINVLERSSETTKKEKVGNGRTPKT